MALRAYTTEDVNDCRLAIWTGLLNGDSGVPLILGIYGDVSVQISGTFGTLGSVTLEGSNDGTNYVALTDPQGNAITKTAASIEQFLERTRYIRPNVTAGDGTTSLVVTVWAARIY